MLRYRGCRASDPRSIAWRRAVFTVYLAVPIRISEDEKSQEDQISRRLMEQCIDQLDTRESFCSGDVVECWNRSGDFELRSIIMHLLFNTMSLRGCSYRQKDLVLRMIINMRCSAELLHPVSSDLHVLSTTQGQCRENMIRDTKTITCRILFLNKQCELSFVSLDHSSTAPTSLWVCFAAYLLQGLQAPSRLPGLCWVQPSRHTRSFVRAVECQKRSKASLLQRATRTISDRGSPQVVVFRLLQI